jgi:hypothetical protein
MGKVVRAALGLTLGAWSTIAGAVTINYHCSFPDAFQRETGMFKQDFGFTIAYDDANQTAAIIGNAGTSPLMVHTGFMVISFIELVGSGVVQTLTMFPSGEAVYSRHTPAFAGTGFFASQQYGTCKP